MDYNRLKNAVDGIKTNDNLEARLLANSCKQDIKSTSISLSIPRRLLVTCIMIIIVCGTAVAAYAAVTGNAFFTQLFTQKSQNSDTDYSYMDTSPLSSISGSNVGTVLQTDEFTFEVVDSVSSGNMAMVAIRVTAKKLDSVLLDEGWTTVPLNNYRFDDVGILMDSMNHFSVSYVYSTDDSSLADNQFYLFYLLNSMNTIEEKNYTLKLSDFGYIPSTTGVMEKLYSDTWNVTLGLNDGSGYSRAILLDKSFSIKKLDFIAKDIVITPMTATVSFYSQSKEDNGRSEAILENSHDFSITLKDGTVLSDKDFSISGTGGSDKIDIWRGEIDVTFEVPINVENIEEVTFMGMSFNLK